MHVMRCNGAVLLNLFHVFYFRIERGSFIATHDIRSMYLHVSLHREAWQYFGFTITNVAGIMEHYCFIVVPFGYCNATALMACLLRPIEIHLHSLSVDVSYYVDDGGNIGVSLSRCSTYQQYTFFVMSCSAWQIATEKTVYPSQIVRYLGFIINTVEMRITAPARKIAKLQLDIDEIIVAGNSGSPVPCRQTASILGTNAHLLSSHGEILKIVSRESQHLLGTAVVAAGWNAHMVISPRMVEELKMCKVYLESHNGRPIRYESRQTTILKPAHKTYLLEGWDPKDDARELITMVSDASATTAFVYQADTFNIVAEFPFNDNEKQTSSTLRELSAIFKLLTSDEKFLKENRGRMVLWLTDSQSLCHIMRRGSRVRQLQEMVLKIFELQHKWGENFPLIFRNLSPLITSFFQGITVIIIVYFFQPCMISYLLFQTCGSSVSGRNGQTKTCPLRTWAPRRPAPTSGRWTTSLIHKCYLDSAWFLPSTLSRLLTTQSASVFSASGQKQILPVLIFSAKLLILQRFYMFVHLLVVYLELGAQFQKLTVLRPLWWFLIGGPTLFSPIF